MSKIYTSVEVTAEHMSYDVKTYDISELEGKLLTFIDATFSDPQQRKAQKDVVRQMLWDWILPKGILGSAGGPINGNGTLDLSNKPFDSVVLC